MTTLISTSRRAKVTPTDEQIRRVVRIIHERYDGDIRKFIRAGRAKKEERTKQSQEIVSRG